MLIKGLYVYEDEQKNILIQKDIILCSIDRILHVLPALRNVVLDISAQQGRVSRREGVLTSPFCMEIARSTLRTSTMCKYTVLSDSNLFASFLWYLFTMTSFEYIVLCS